MQPACISTDHRLQAVRDFQPLYEWSPKHLDEVRIGADMIREDIALQDEKKLLEEANMVANKHAAKEAAEKACGG